MNWLALARRYWWVWLALACLGLGWLLRGWAAQPVDANTRAILDTLRVTREQYADATQARTNTLKQLNAALTALNTAQGAKDSIARTLYGEARRHRQQAGALERELAAAASAADSVPILLTQKAQLSAALDTMERVVTAQEASRSILEQRIENQSSQLVIYREQRTADSTRLHLQDIALKGLVKAKSPCGRWCPTLIGSYEVQNHAIAVGAGLRPRSWLTLGVTYRVN